MIGNMKVQIICLTLCFLLAGCSYTMDFFESVIMSRAGFSISASYDKSTNSLNIAWSENANQDSFAGFEVYMIPQPWNEFGTYEVIAAPYNIQSSPRFFREISSLSSSYTKDVSITVSPSDLNGEGEYYVRLGIIGRGMDEDGNYYIMNTDNYEKHTSISQISGYQPVYIH